MCNNPMDNETFVANADEGKIRDLMKKTQENVDLFNKMAKGLIEAQSKDLDGLMEDIRAVITKRESPSTETLDRYYMELTEMFYFKSAQFEASSIYMNMSKIAAKEAYNKTYLGASLSKDERGKSRTTVAENTATAEMNSQYETVVAQIYEYVFKVLRQKLEAAMEMITTLKNVLKRRSNEEYFEAVATNAYNNREIS